LIEPDVKRSEPTIVTMGPGHEDRILEVCELLVRSFRDLSPTWVPTVEAARAKVVGALEPGMLSRVLLIDGRVVGWVGARHDYGSVWELHPLVVDEGMRGRGYGRALVNDVERLAAGNGALTMLLGTSDEVGRTTLTGQDLFLDVITALRDLKPTGAHPLGFWQRVGYTVVGVIPDAEGPGKPTILLAKRTERGA
jgi:aminoglycoside 6'-N-acetyltransferase I